MERLNGLRPAKDRQVLYNGQEYYRSLAAFSTQLGYVPQDDIVHRDSPSSAPSTTPNALPEGPSPRPDPPRVDEVLSDVRMEERRSLLVSSSPVVSAAVPSPWIAC